MHGGLKVYRGSPAAARSYVEADRGRADDYYLAEGTGVAQRYLASPDAGVRRERALNGDAYEAWVGGDNPTPARPREGCGPTTRRSGSSRSWSTVRRPGHWRPHCTQTSPRPTTARRTGRPSRSSGGWPSTRPHGSVHVGARSSYRSRSSKRSRCGTTPPVLVTHTGT